MESEKDMMRWRSKQALRPIKTKRSTSRVDSGEEINKKEEEPVSPAGRLFLEPKVNPHIIAIIGFKTSVDPNVAKAKLPHTLLKHPRFSSLLVVDKKDERKMKWVRTDVDLKKHVIVPEIEANIDIAPDKFVEDYIYNLTKTSLDKSKPLWEVHIINLKTSNAESVIVFNIHHSLGDGVSLISLLLACTRQTADPEALPTLPAAATRKKEITKGGGSIGSYLRCFCLGFWWRLRLFWNTFVDVMMFIATALLLIKDTETPIKGRPPGSASNMPRRIVLRVVSLDDMKLVKNAMKDVTINDVALGVTQAGLSKYLNRRYGWNEKKNNLPPNICLRSVLFFNLRPSTEIQALTDMMEKNTKAKWGNWIGSVLLPLSIGLKPDDPLDYIREAKATMDRKKHSFEAFCTFAITGLVFKFFGIKAASALFGRLFSSTTMAFSNVVGPLEEVTFYSYPLSYLAATTYAQANAKLTVNFTSNRSNMTIVLSVEENTIPDPHQLCDDIVESLKLIKDAVVDKENIVQ